MLTKVKRTLARRALRDGRYDFLFAPEHPEEVVCFDCETTGLDPRTAELISLAAVRIRGSRVLTSQRLDMVIKPTRAIADAAIKVHRLRHQDVAHGIPVEEALDRFLRFVGSRPLVGYYLEFDVAMVNRALKPWLGIGLPNRRIEVSALFYDLVARGTRDVTYTGNVDLSFNHILDTLDLPRLTAHDAFNDALMAALMYVKIKDRMRGGV